MDTQKLFDTKFNYQKIATKGDRTDSIPAAGFPPTTTAITIPHNLGKISSARAWFDPGNGRRFPISFEQYTDDTTSVSETGFILVQKAYLTTDNLVIEYLNNAGSTKSIMTYWRVYYDT